MKSDVERKVKHSEVPNSENLYADTGQKSAALRAFPPFEVLLHLGSFFRCARLLCVAALAV